MSPLKWFKMIPLKIIEYSHSHVGDFLLICPHARNFYKIENMYRLIICMFHMYICCYKRYFDGHDIFYYVIHVDNTYSKFLHNQSLDFYD